ncbi:MULTISPECIES: hypothetical protein [unclassified Sphingobium]|nr:MULTISPECIES: hypothetical protein [unclassified Sphingobium]MCW2413516.1 hypothetical protein [Sphingobium sp. B8D3D]MCW2414184.1 hypothetical protein [Sphingobium sp. B8D3A]
MIAAPMRSGAAFLREQMQTEHIFAFTLRDRQSMIATEIGDKR